MYFRRLHVTALVAALIALLAYVVVPKIVDSINAADARARLVAADKAFNRLKVPRDFVPIKSGCQSYPCFYVPRSTFQVRSELPAILESTGATQYAPLATQCPTPPRQARSVLCGFLGQSHSYEVIVFLGAYLAICGTHCTPTTRFQALVQITPPYIPPDPQ